LVDRSTAHLVLTYAHLNTYGLNGTQVEQLRDDYLAAGLQDKLLYIDEPLAGHEYNVYHLKEIMAFFDRFCKP
jgi:adenine-specific DNA methylase